jgi:hypothetical protein
MRRELFLRSAQVTQIKQTDPLSSFIFDLLVFSSFTGHRAFITLTLFDFLIISTYIRVFYHDSFIAVTAINHFFLSVQDTGTQ